jgi:hypothetical protein
VPVHPPVPSPRGLVLVLAALLLTSCGAGAAAPGAAPPPSPAADPAARADRDDPGAETAESAPSGVGAHEVTLVADFGPLPDGSGDAVIETIWTVDAAGTRSLVVDTPAGFAAHHVMTDDEHWWWLDPTVRETIADAEWIHFDLHEIEEVGGELPAIGAEARVPLPDPGGIRVGHIVAGHEVLAVDVVGADEAHLTAAGIERAVVHRRRPLPVGTTIEPPDDAIDVADLPDVLRW